MGHRSICNVNQSMEDNDGSHKKLRHLAVSLRDARAVNNSPTLLTVFLPACADVKVWEKRLGSRPQSRVSSEGEYMQNLSRVSDHWEEFERVAATAQRQFRHVVQDNMGRLPKTGIVMFIGSADHEDVVFAPPSAVQAPVHLCDAKFHVEYLSHFTSNRTYGFVVVDGNGCLFGTLSGHDKRVRDKFSVDLPKKHSKGGQSALRFARLRLEKRHNYLRKVSEHATKCFISEERPNICGLILAGAAELKNDLSSSCLLDPRLKSILVSTLDISYGGECGFMEAISLSADMLKDLDFLKERQTVSSFLGEVAMDRGLYCFGVQDCMAALECGAADTLIIWDELPVQRLVIRTDNRDTTDVLYVNSRAQFAALAADVQVEESNRLVDWMVENHNRFGAKLELITDQSSEGVQFSKGFGGIGAILRYAIDLESAEEQENAPSDSDSDFA